MSQILVDTNVVSYRIKGDSRGPLYDRHLAGYRPLVSFMTPAEMYRWAVTHRWGEPRIGELRARLNEYVVIPYDDEIAWQWATVSSIPGRPMEPGDAWVAAAALRHNLPLVTHNRRHFDHVPGLTVISEAP